MAWLEIEGISPDSPTIPFRCIGMRTDMKAKIFEWVDADLSVPPPLLRDPAGGVEVDDALKFATDCEQKINYAFRQTFKGESQKGERHQGLRIRMRDHYWASLADPFRQYVFAATAPDQREAERRQWAAIVVRQAQEAFKNAAAAVGDDATSLRQRVEGQSFCDKLLFSKRKEYVLDEPTEQD
jgi:CRISPR system Cascade subunit CasA